MKSVNSEFDVGTIVYFISSKNEKVIPALVAEKIVRTSLANSSKVTYILEIRTGKTTTKSIEVDPTTADLFSNPQEIRVFMIARTTKAIDDLIAVAVEAASSFSAAKHTQEEISSPTFDAGEDIAVVLEDGKVAKLRM
jgi:hypothetical protein